MEVAEVSHTFYVFRYTIVQESQAQLYTEPLPRPKGKAVIKALGVNEADKYFGKNGVSYSFVGFKWAQPTTDYNFPADRFLIGKLAKKRLTETGTHVPGDIVMRPQEDWIGLIAIFDTLTQHVVVEKNWKFGNPEQTGIALQAGLSKTILDVYNSNVFVKGRTKEHAFWNIIKESNKIYSLELKLISPNLLEANKNARKALEDLKKIFVQDEIDISLKNESGSLTVPEEPVADYINYIAEGEGSWKVTSQKRDGRKKVFSSFQNLDTLELPFLETTAQSMDSEAKEIPNKEVLLLVSISYRALEEYSED